MIDYLLDVSSQIRDDLRRVIDEVDRSYLFNQRPTQEMLARWLRLLNAAEKIADDLADECGDYLLSRESRELERRSAAKGDGKQATATAMDRGRP
jgi:hypothetical protein